MEDSLNLSLQNRPHDFKFPNVIKQNSCVVKFKVKAVFCVSQGLHPLYYQIDRNQGRTIYENSVFQLIQ